jgi:hypothetical protein
LGEVRSGARAAAAWGATAPAFGDDPSPASSFPAASSARSLVGVVKPADVGSEPGVDDDAAAADADDDEEEEEEEAASTPPSAVPPPSPAPCCCVRLRVECGLEAERKAWRMALRVRIVFAAGTEEEEEEEEGAPAPEEEPAAAPEKSRRFPAWRARETGDRTLSDGLGKLRGREKGGGGGVRGRLRPFAAPPSHFRDPPPRVPAVGTSVPPRVGGSVHFSLCPDVRRPGKGEGNGAWPLSAERTFPKTESPPPSHLCASIRCSSAGGWMLRLRVA